MSETRKLLAILVADTHANGICRATHFKEVIMHMRVQRLSSVAVTAAAFFATAAIVRAATVADFYQLMKPAGDGPFPAVVLAPGCGGFHDQYSPPVFDQYRKRLERFPSWLNRLGFPTADRSDS